MKRNRAEGNKLLKTYATHSLVIFVLRCNRQIQPSAKSMQCDDAFRSVLFESYHDSALKYKAHIDLESH